MGGGYFYKQLNKDVKEINKVFLSLFSVGIILIAIFVGINLTKSSYALFSDTIIGEKTIEVEVENNIPNPPVLDTHMVPVYYDETAEVWRKADSTNEKSAYQWYDYDNKMWANSVTVTSSSRSTYLNASPGTEIDMDDILTMQVWVPRYKYKVWNYNSDGTVTSEPQEIEIVFEEGTNSTGEITCTDNIQGEDGDGTSEVCKLNNQICTDNLCNGSYYTHPAFTFGSEELTGFWVGKFELTGTIDNITTKPSEVSLRNQRVGDFSTNIMSMNDSGNIYGFTNNADTHLIKNSEWGSVAYLSHSKYGTCDNGECREIGLNSYEGYVTGCGPVATGSIITGTTCNSYNTELGILASTTGNIYGVYDMSGGAYDATMANIVSPDGVTMMSGRSTTDNSGYTGITYNNGSYTNFTGINYPEEKYYDKYSFNVNRESRIRGKLGDSTKETFEGNDYGWYDDDSLLGNAGYPWFVKGGYYGLTLNSGIFSTRNFYGYIYNPVSSRLVVVN